MATLIAPKRGIVVRTCRRTGALHAVGRWFSYHVECERNENFVRIYAPVLAFYVVSYTYNIPSVIIFFWYLIMWSATSDLCVCRWRNRGKTISPYFSNYTRQSGALKVSILNVCGFSFQNIFFVNVYKIFNSPYRSRHLEKFQ